MMEHARTKFKGVSRRNPCPVCEGIDGCSIGEDGLFLCRRREGQQSGFVHLGQSKADAQWTVYRREGDPHLASDNGMSQRRPSANGQRRQALNWQDKATTLAHNLTPAHRRPLADVLGLPEAVFSELPLLGYCAEGPHKGDDKKSLGECWTFPEVDAEGRVIGVTCRYVDGGKKAWPDGKRGLTIPENWRSRSDAVFLVEGPSDVLALTAIGLAAIGRPSNMGGVELLAELLRDVPTDRQIIVLGEMDPKENGQWPGKDGAMKTAEELTARLGRPVQWALPPDKAKDVRQWVLDQKPDRACADEWSDLGGKLLTNLKPINAVSDNRVSGGGAVSHLICTNDVRPERVVWLWASYIPLGKSAMLDGDPGLGKSTVALDLAARVSTGEKMPDGSSGVLGDVILLSAEDGLADTIVPRLISAGADRQRVFALEMVKDADGERGLHLPTDIERIRDAAEGKDVKLIVIDPLVAYLGGEVKSHNDQDVRRVMRPLAKLAEDIGAAMLLIRHLNKSTGGNPLYRGGGSIAFTAAVRAAMLVAKNPDDDGRRVLAVYKSNLAEKPPALGFEIPKVGDGAAKIKWTGPSQHTAESLLAAPTDEEERGAVAEAIDFLKEFLASGTKPANDVKREARKAGIAERTLHRAKYLLGVRSRKMGYGQDSEWHWFLPEQVPEEPKMVNHEF